MKKEKKAGKTRTEKKKAAAAKKELKKIEAKAQANFTDEIMPVVGYNEDYDVFVMEDGTIMDILGINAKNLMSASENEIAYDIMCWDKLFKTFVSDLKIICFNFPTDTTKQQSYISRKIEKQKNPLLREILWQKEAELQWISLNRKDREFAICFYSRSIDEYRKNYLQIYSQLSSATSPLCRKLTAEKKKQIIYNLYNKNCAV